MANLDNGLNQTLLVGSSELPDGLPKLIGEAVDPESSYRHSLKRGIPRYPSPLRDSINEPSPRRLENQPSNLVLMGAPAPREAPVVKPQKSQPASTQQAAATPGKGNIVRRTIDNAIEGIWNDPTALANAKHEFAIDFVMDEGLRGLAARALKKDFYATFRFALLPEVENHISYDTLNASPIRNPLDVPGIESHTYVKFASIPVPGAKQPVIQSVAHGGTIWSFGGLLIGTEGLEREFSKTDTEQRLYGDPWGEQNRGLARLAENFKDEVFGGGSPDAIQTATMLRELIAGSLKPVRLRVYSDGADFAQYRQTTKIDVTGLIVDLEICHWRSDTVFYRFKLLETEPNLAPPPPPTAAPKVPFLPPLPSLFKDGLKKIPGVGAIINTVDWANFLLWLLHHSGLSTGGASLPMPGAMAVNPSVSRTWVTDVLKFGMNNYLGGVTTLGEALGFDDPLRTLGDINKALTDKLRGRLQFPSPANEPTKQGALQPMMNTEFYAQSWQDFPMPPPELRPDPNAPLAAIPKGMTEQSYRSLLRQQYQQVTAMLTPKGVDELPELRVLPMPPPDQVALTPQQQYALERSRVSFIQEARKRDAALIYRNRNRTGVA